MGVTRSVCNFCHVLCPALVHVEDDRVTRIEADREHPHGGLFCVKGKAAGELAHHPERVLSPLRRIGPKTSAPRWERVSWAEALDDIAARLLRIRAESGPEAIVFSRGTKGGTGLVDAERWLFRLASCLGTPNIVSTTHLCQWTRDDGARYTFGLPTPAPDLERAGCYLLWGHNPSATNIRMAHDVKAARARGMKLVVVDPRRVGLATQADVHLAVHPGTDGALALSLAHVLVDRGWIDAAFVERWTNGPLLVRRDTGRLLRWEELTADGQTGWVGWAGRPLRYDPRLGRYEGGDPTLSAEAEVTLASGPRVAVATVFQLFRELLDEYGPERASRITRVPESDIHAAAELLAKNGPVAHYFWNGIAQNTNSAQTARAISVLYALLGWFDAPGGNVVVPRPPLRPVDESALLGPEARSRRLGWAERPLGPARTRRDSTAYDLYRSLLEGEPYRARALLDFGNNMLMANAGSAHGREALEQLELMVYVDYFLTPTAELADYVLPTASFLEAPAVVSQWDHPIPARRRLQYRPAAISPRGDARSDTQIIFDLAVRLGFGEKFWNGDVEAGFRYELEGCGITLEQLRAEPHGIDAVPNRSPLGGRAYARTDASGRAAGFQTPTGKIEIYAVPFADHGEDPLPRFAPPRWADEVDRATFPFVLTNAKVSQFCHAQHRALPSLRRARPQPEVELSPETARLAGVEDGEWVVVQSPEGEMRAMAKVTNAVQPGVLVTQHGWWQACSALDLPGQPAFDASGSNVNLLVDNRAYDAISGATAHRSVPCRLGKIPVSDVGGK